MGRHPDHQPDGRPSPDWKPRNRTTRRAVDVVEDAQFVRDHGGYRDADNTQIAMRLGVSRDRLDQAYCRARRYAAAAPPRTPRPSQAESLAPAANAARTRDLLANQSGRCLVICSCLQRGFLGMENAFGGENLEVQQHRQPSTLPPATRATTRLNGLVCRSAQ